MSGLSPIEAKSALNTANVRGHKTVAKLLKRYGNIEKDDDEDVDDDGNDRDESNAWSNVEV